jgi:geranylgeranyl pyrophosphate synthase
MRTRDLNVKNRYIRILEETGSIKYTKEFLTQLHDEISQKIKDLGDNPVMQEAIDRNLDEVLNSKLNVEF